MADFDFTSPDGKQYSVSGPDGATPEQAFAILQQHIGAPQAAAPASTEDSSIADVAKSGGVGLAKGIIGLAGLPGDLTNLASLGFDYATGKNTNATIAPYANAIGSEAIQHGIENKITGPFYQPKSTAGQYAQTIGEFGPALFGGPESLATKLATRVALPAIASETAGQVTQGTGLEPYARAGGALLGAGLPAAASRAISPTTIDAANAGAVKTLSDAGVNLTAGQKSGSKVVKYMESELGDSLGAGGKATAANEAALSQYTAAVANKVPEFAGTKVLTPDELNAGISKIGAKFDAVAAANPEIKLDGKFVSDAEKIKSDFEGLTGNKPKLIDDFIKRMGPASETPLPEAGSTISAADFRKLSAATTSGPPVISGATYQAIRSEIGSLARSASRPEVAQSLYKFQNALDQAIGRNLANPADKEAWAQARRSWLNSLILKDALNTSTEDAARGLITPAKLTASIKKFQQDGYTRGRNDFSDLARAGNTVMKQLPQSGTAPRSAAHLIPSVVGAGIGAGLGGIGGVIGGIAGPALLGRALMSKPMQAYLSNQKAVPLRQIPLAKNMLKGGILSLQGNR